MKFKYLLFDLDGTLTNPFEGITRCVQYALFSCGINEPDLNKLKPFIGPPLVDAFMQFYGLPKDVAYFALEKYRERFSKKGWLENELFDGIENLLRDLNSADYTIALATSKPEDFAVKILNHFNIGKYFDVTVGATMDNTRSNKSDVIKEVFNRLSLNDSERSSVLMIGDRMHDILGAKENGIKSLGVKFGFATPDELENADADFIVNNIDELRKFLLS